MVLSRSPTTAPPATRGNLIACILIANSLVALWITVGRWEFIVPHLIVLALQPLWGNRLNVQPGLIAYLFFAVPYAALYNEYEPAIGERGGALFSEMFFAALYLQAVGIFQLYRQPRLGRQPLFLSFTGLGLASMGRDFPTTIEVLGNTFSALTVYSIMVGVYAVGCLFLTRSYLTLQRLDGKRAKVNATSLLVIGIFFALSLVMAGGVSSVFRNHFSQMDRAFLNLIRAHVISGAAGFSNSAKIGSVSAGRYGANANRIAIRAFSDTAPGYLRGKIFSLYRNGNWTEPDLGRDFTVAKGGKRTRQVSAFAFPGRPPSTASEPAMMIFPIAKYDAHFFLPLETVAVKSSSNLVRLFQGYILNTKYAPTSRGYGVFVSPHAPLYDLPLIAPDGTAADAPDTKNVTLYYSRFPANVKGEKDLLSPLAMRIQEIRTELGLTDALRQKPDMVVNILAAWFADTYEYKIGWQQKDSALDPVHDFLNPAAPNATTKKIGHCELYAASGALILRHMGIPSRYVTGFVCSEQNAYDKRLYIARRKHAHAWVEYFTPDVGWRLAEFTPANGQPQFNPPAGFAAFMEYLGGIWNQTIGYFQRRGIRGIFELVAVLGGWLIGAWWRMGLLALGFCIYIYRRFFRDRTGRGKERQRIHPFSTEVTELRQEYHRRQTQLANQGLAKQESETLPEYIARLVDEEDEAFVPEREETLAFLQHFAAVRYAVDNSHRRTV